MTMFWEPLLGGMLIGLSATILLLINGKVAGISGVLSGLLQPKKKDRAWRILFVLGVMFGGALASSTGFSFPDSFSNANMGVVMLAGLLVGIGTKLGNGCTSGHGICGIGRMSVRSLVATMVFMATAAIVVFVRLHLMV